MSRNEILHQFAAKSALSDRLIARYNDSCDLAGKGFVAGRVVGRFWRAVQFWGVALFVGAVLCLALMQLRRITGGP